MVWPLHSPVAARGGGVLALEFAAYPLVKTADGWATICAGGVAREVPADAMVSGDGTVARIEASQLSAERPDLLFWDDRAGLSAFLGGDRRAAPQFEELRAVQADAPVALAVLGRETLVPEGRRRGSDVAELLLAVHRDAAAAYLDLTHGGGDGIPPAVVLDVSGGAVAYTQSYLRRLALSLRDTDVLLTDVALYYLGGDSALDPRGITNLAAAASMTLPDGPPVDPAALAAARQVLDLASLASDEGARDVLVLAGGDVSVAGSGTFADLRFVDVVPEHHDALRQSVVSSAYFAFADGDPTALGDALREDRDFQPPLGENAADFIGVAQAQVAHGFLPILPVERDDRDSGLWPSAGAEGADWVGFRLWTVINPDMMVIGAP